jgi:integrase
VRQEAKPNELRNAAVLLLLARLGLRAGEVGSPCLEDFYCAEGRLLISAGKSHRERTLPLEEQIGQALVEYLRDRRPRALHRHLDLKGKRRKERSVRLWPKPLRSFTNGENPHFSISSLFKQIPCGVLPLWYKRSTWTAG